MRGRSIRSRVLPPLVASVSEAEPATPARDELRPVFRTGTSLAPMRILASHEGPDFRFTA